MAFKIPLPVVRKNPQRLPEQLWPSTDIGLPNFERDEFTDLVLIGEGSFGKVYRGVREGSLFVIKQLSNSCSSMIEKKLFIKEAEILKSLQGHENVVQIRGFSPVHGILMDYVQFDFVTIGIEHERVSSLKDFLNTCDNLNDFQGFVHLSCHLAADICVGLGFLHSKNVVHRDLKPENILLSNNHYINCNASDLPSWWTVRPIKAQLTDFGESRSKLLSTKTVTNTSTYHLCRGSPAYMAPEALSSENKQKASIEQLKEMDIWSLGMVFFNLLNPDAQYPYSSEMDRMIPSVDSIQALKDLHKSLLVPNHSHKYKTEQEGAWKSIDTVFRMCATFIPANRPCANNLVHILKNSISSTLDKLDRDPSDHVDSNSISSSLDELDRDPSDQVASNSISSALDELDRDPSDQFASNSISSAMDELDRDPSDQVASNSISSAMDELDRDPSDQVASNSISSAMDELDRDPSDQVASNSISSAMDELDRDPSDQVASNSISSALDELDRDPSDQVDSNSISSSLDELDCRDPSDKVDSNSISSSLDELDCRDPSDKVDSNSISSALDESNRDPTDSRTVDDNDEAIFKNISKTNRWHDSEFSLNRWKDCEVQNVEEIPANVDGWCKFKIACELKDMMKVSKDGRPWRIWYTSSRKDFSGVRRITRCKGSPICKSSSCPYKEQFGYPNRLQFKKQSNILVCFTCMEEAEHTPCTGLKMWEYDNTAKTATIFHDGLHTCVAKPKLGNQKKTILQAIRSNPNVKPSRLVNNEIVNMMSNDNFEWKTVETIAENFADVQMIQNVRNQFRRDQNPMGENFDALAVFKKKCDEKDEFLIYSVNNRALNGKPSFVFKSSLAMANLALAMDKDKQGVLCNEYAHVDATHTHCRGFKTVTLWTYHPVLRKLLRIAIMEVEEENTENLSQFWHLLNQMLSKVSGEKNYTFRPTGFVADEHHANWKSIENVFGREVIESVVSCEFHFKESVHRHARRVGLLDDKFIELAEALLTALNETEFELARRSMENFVKENTELAHWFKWWMERRTHIFRMFKSAQSPASNLAEIGHAKMSSVGRRNMSLLEAAREDVAAAIRQETEVRLFDKGHSKGGKGKDIKAKRALVYKAEMKRAEAYGAEIENKFGKKNSDELQRPPKFVPQTGRHRPADKRQKHKCSQVQAARVIKKARQTLASSLATSVASVNREETSMKSRSKKSHRHFVKAKNVPEISPKVWKMRGK